MDEIQLARGCWTIHIDIYFPSSTIFTSHCKWSTRVSISTAHPCISCLNMIAHGNATIREHLQQASFCCLDDAPVGVEKYQDFGAEKTPYYWDLRGSKFLLTLTCPFTSLNLVWRIIQIGWFLQQASTMKSKPPVFVGGISWTRWHLVALRCWARTGSSFMVSSSIVVVVARRLKSSHGPSQHWRSLGPAKGQVKCHQTSFRNNTIDKWHESVSCLFWTSN